MRFTYIHLTNWRNFKRVEIDLQQRMFLIGANATGKSNFLDVFRFLSELVAVGGGLQYAIQKRGGVSVLRSFSARKSPDITVEIQLGDEDRPKQWVYALTIKQDSQRHVHVKEERVLYYSAPDQPKVILSRPNESDKSDPERLTQTYLEQINANQDFRDIANFFQTVRYLHIVPQIVREPERVLRRANDPFGGDFLERIATTNKKTQQKYLRQITDALKSAIPQLTHLELTQDKRGVPHLRGKYKHWRPEGQWLDEGQFSDGTLRLIGILWAILSDEGPLLLEEPELSLHAEVVALLPQVIARVQRTNHRQIFISTHSPDLLKDSGIPSDEVLVLTPAEEETKVQLANQIDLVLNMGPDVNLAEVLIPLTRPKDLQQLTFFADH